MVTNKSLFVASSWFLLYLLIKDTRSFEHKGIVHYVGNLKKVYILMHGQKKSQINLTSLLIDWLGRYARFVDHLAVRNVAQGAPLGGDFVPSLLLSL